jgi:hydroxyethylthiazole kinase-like uncharacterized protein yjeF
MERALYLSEHIRACEQQAQQHYQLSEQELMSRAGKEAFLLMRQLHPKLHHIAVFCGAGNNAGDGYVLALLAHQHQLTVRVYQCKDPKDLPFAAQQAALNAVAAGVPCCSVQEPLAADVELIVDALLGIGLKGKVHGIIATAIERINASGIPVLALDIPSGLNADTGEVEESGVKADATVTFIAPKLGMYTLDGPDYCGSIYCNSLQLDDCSSSLKPDALLLDRDHLPVPLTARPKNSHKGDYGSVLIIGGGRGMPGAVGLAAKAALRCGAGLVTIATWKGHAASVIPLVPESMVWEIKSAKELKPLLAKASVCVLGPGLGEDAWAKKLVTAVLDTSLPLVVDASALKLLAQIPQKSARWVLTPHPGEAGSLLGCSAQEIQKNRYQAVKALQQRYGGVIVLKGCGTLIQTECTPDDEPTFVCPLGNPGMASAGMGDVLSGIIAGFCAQGLSLSAAAKLGVWVHARSGDVVASYLGERGLLASDVLDVVPTVLNSCKRY